LNLVPEPKCLDRQGAAAEARGLTGGLSGRGALRETKLCAAQTAYTCLLVFES
jgi:hypothetical protein